MFNAILAVALTLPAYSGDQETPNQRLERVSVIARAVDKASAKATCAHKLPEGSPRCRRVWPGSQRELAALLLTQAWHESRLAEHVHADRCGPLECDRGFAKSLWQVHASGNLPKARWLTIGGTDQESTDRAAKAATRYLAGARARCGRMTRGTGADWAAYTIAGYATGNECTWKGAKGRAATMRRLLASPKWRTQ